MGLAALQAGSYSLQVVVVSLVCVGIVGVRRTNAIYHILIISRISRINLNLLLNLAVGAVATPLVLIANNVHLLDLRQIIPLEYRILNLRAQDIIYAVALTIECMVILAGVPLIIRHNTLNRQILHLISLHLHLHPLILRILIQNQRGDRRDRLVVAPLNVG